MARRNEQTFTATFVEPVADIAPDRVTEVSLTETGLSHWLVIRDETSGITAMINFGVLGTNSHDRHIDLDVHSFVDGEPATAAAFGLSRERRSRARFSHDDHGAPRTTSHGWPSANLVAVLIGRQEIEPTESAPSETTTTTDGWPSPTCPAEVGVLRRRGTTPVSS